MYDDAFVKLANSDGWRAITCPGCRESRIRVTANSQSPTAITAEDPCSVCEGAGRQWQYGTSTTHLTDRELATRLGVTLGTGDAG